MGSSGLCSPYLSQKKSHSILWADSLSSGPPGKPTQYRSSDTWGPSFVASLGNGTTGNSDKEGATCSDPRNPSHAESRVSAALGQSLTAGKMKATVWIPCLCFRTLLSGPARVAFALGKVWGAPCRHPTEELLAALCHTSCYLHRGAAGSEDTVGWPV